MPHSEQAIDALRTADAHAGDTQVGDHSAAMALIGIGYALLHLAEVVERNGVIFEEASPR